MKTPYLGLTALLWLQLTVAPQSLALEFQVLDENQKPVGDAVIEVVSPAGTGTVGSKAEMGQRDKQFSPRMIVVKQGTSVAFPNYDDIKHHIFSFSSAKIFEQALYKGGESEPVTFDKAGVVELGCNVHDWMVGYIYVASSPVFGISDSNGKASIGSKTSGEVQVKVWHELLGTSDANVITTTLKADANGNYAIALPINIDDQESFDIDELGDY